MVENAANAVSALHVVMCLNCVQGANRGSPRINNVRDVTNSTYTIRCENSSPFIMDAATGGSEKCCVRSSNSNQFPVRNGYRITMWGYYEAQPAPKHCISFGILRSTLTNNSLKHWHWVSDCSDKKMLVGSGALPFSICSDNGLVTAAVSGGTW